MTETRRPARLTGLMLVLLALVAGAVAPAAAPAAPAAKDKKKCADKKRSKKDRQRCGGSGSGDDDDVPPWQTRWRFSDVHLDGTTTMRWQDDSTLYTVDGKMTYRGPNARGYLDLRGKEAAAPGTWVGTAEPVDVTSVARARYVHLGEAYDCTTRTPDSLMPDGLAAVASKAGREFTIQWSLVTTPVRCPVAMVPTWSTPLPSRAMVTHHPAREVFGRRVRLEVRIDQTMRETYGTLRVTWKGYVELTRADPLAKGR